MKTPARAPDVRWQGESISRVVLGTVQLGLPYGIANTGGQPDPRTARAIVEAAWDSGIRHFDTAQAYGNSEQVLGEALRALGLEHAAQVASKLATALTAAPLSEIADAIDRSLDRLGVERLWCMMCHSPVWLDRCEQGLGDLLHERRASGRIQHLGVSLSYPEEFDRCLAHPDMEILQIPCNAWDRRPIAHGVFDTARAHGQLCCVRSIYLKGLLVLPSATAAERLPIAREATERWHALAARYGLSVTELAVRFARTLDTPLVVGAETPDQVRDTARLAALAPLPQDVLDDLAATLDPVLNDVILTPRSWEGLEAAIYNPSEQQRR